MIMLTVAAMALAATPQSMRILFIGNSHTAVNDLPAMVKSLLESDGSGRHVETERVFHEFLNEGYGDASTWRKIGIGGWNYVVLQGAKASSSHKYTYNNDGAAELGKLAIKSRARALYFVEWPRRDWDESEFQMGVYRPIQAAARGSELVPVCYAWDAILKKAPNLDLWASDGNHASPLGTYLAANVFYYYLAGTNHDPSWVLPGVDAKTNALVRQSAKDALAPHAAKKSA